jgi:hypothetical protein
MSLEEAEGYLALRLWKEAFDTVQALPFEERFTGAAMTIQLTCCAALKHWREGRRLARQIVGGGNIQQRKEASTFYQLDAIACFRDLDSKGGVRAVDLAIGAWPDDSMEVLDHEILKGAVALARET